MSNTKSIMIAFKTKNPNRALKLARSMAAQTYDQNATGKMVLVDEIAARDVLERIYLDLCLSDQPCVWSKLTHDEVIAFPSRKGNSAANVSVIAAIHCVDGSYGFAIGQCDEVWRDDQFRFKAAAKKAIDAAIRVSLLK